VLVNKISFENYAKDNKQEGATTPSKSMQQIRASAF
jgi:hypothetical protein